MPTPYRRALARTAVAVATALVLPLAASAVPEPDSVTATATASPAPSAVPEPPTTPAPPLSSAPPVPLAFGIAEAAASSVRVSAVNVVAAYDTPTGMPARVTAVNPDLTFTQRVVDWSPIDQAIFRVPGAHDVAGVLHDTGQAVRGRITVSAPGRVVKVAAVGDSITAGMGTSSSANNSYPAQLQTMLGTGFSVQNFGASGYTVLSKGDAPYKNHRLFTDSKNFQPDVVLFQLGTNDSKPQNWKSQSAFVADYQAFIAAYRDLPSKPVVYAMLPPAVRGNGAFGITDSGVTLVIGRILEALTAAGFENVTIIDNNTPFRGVLSYLPDTVHPNNEGATFLADNIRRQFTGDETRSHSRKVPATSLTGVSGMYLDSSSDDSGYRRLASVNVNDWVSFSRVDFDRNTTNSFYARYATGYSDVTMTVRVDSPTGPVVSQQMLARTGSANTWDTQIVPTTKVTGVHDVYLSFSRPGASASQELASLVWVNFTPKDKVANPGFGRGWDTVRPSEQDVTRFGDGRVGILSAYGDLYGSYNNAQNLVLHDLEAGDFTATLEMDYKPDATTAATGLIVYLDDNDYFGVVRKYSGRALVAAVNEANGSFSEKTIADPIDSSKIYFKIERVGTTLTGSYSADNRTWKTLWVGANNKGFTNLTELKVGLYAARGVSRSPEALVTFGALTVNGETVSYDQ